MKNIVTITGCFGFIGSYVTDICLSKGWYVRGIDKITYASIPVNEREYILKNRNFTFDQIDINDITHLHDCNYIINCAAETHVDNSIMGNDVFVHSNINGVHHILELIKNKTYKPTLIHFSTDEVYGDIVKGSHKETDVLKPSNPYSATKAAADMLIQGWHRTYGIPYIIVRPTNNYGFGQHIEKLIPRAIRCIDLGQKIPLHNNGTPVRTWLHASDTANAIVTIIEKGIKNEVYNIGGNTELTNKEVIEKIIVNCRLINKESTTKYNLLDYCDFSYNRQGQDLRYSLDDSKLRLLGWEPQVNFNLELANIVKHTKGKFRW